MPSVHQARQFERCARQWLSSLHHNLPEDRLKRWNVCVCSVVMMDVTGVQVETGKSLSMFTPCPRAHGVLHSLSRTAKYITAACGGRSPPRSERLGHLDFPTGKGRVLRSAIWHRAPTSTTCGEHKHESYSGSGIISKQLPTSFVFG